MNDIDRIREAAMTSIGRACLFVLLAVATVMAGLVAWPYLAFKSGAILTSLLAAILMLRGALAHRQDFRRTETWILLRKHLDLPAERAQRVIAGVLQETYRKLAVYAAMFALACWVFAFAAWFMLPQTTAAPRMLV